MDQAWIASPQSRRKRGLPPAPPPRVLSQYVRRNGRRSWFGKRDRRGLSAQADQMTDREHQIGAVHGVEVQLLDAMVDEVEHLLGAHSRGDETARRRVVFQAIKPVSEPLRHARSRSASEIGGLLE